MDGDLGKIIRTAFEANGLYATSKMYDSGLRYFTTSTKPLRSVEDLQGLKLRVGVGKIYVDSFASLGCSNTVTRTTPPTVVGSGIST